MIQAGSLHVLMLLRQPCYALSQTKLLTQPNKPPGSTTVLQVLPRCPSLLPALAASPRPICRACLPQASQQGAPSVDPLHVGIPCDVNQWMLCCSLCWPDREAPSPHLLNECHDAWRSDDAGDHGWHECGLHFNGCQPCVSARW